VNRLGARRPTALIVDFGGVMTVAEDDVLGAFCGETGADPARLRTIVAGAFDGSDPDGLVARRERGQIPLEEFERALATALSEGLSQPIEPGGLHGRLFATERLDDAMVDTVRALREAGIATAMLSNTWGDGAEQDALGDLFDALVLSGRVGLRKPEPGIFLAATDALGVQPGACVFIDDIAANVDAAERVGMKGIVHRATGSTIGALEIAFGIALVHRDAPPMR
jgi:putative hydrolase of the HAD superfamily